MSVASVPTAASRTESVVSFTYATPTSAPASTEWAKTGISHWDSTEWAKTGISHWDSTEWAKTGISHWDSTEWACLAA